MILGNKQDLYDSKNIESVSKKKAEVMAQKVGAFTSKQCSAKEHVLFNGKKGNLTKVIC